MIRIFLLALLALSLPAYAQSNDFTGDLNTNIEDSAVDSNNTTNNYNATGAGNPAPVMTAVSPTVMGGGGNDSCLIPQSTGLQLSIIGISEGGMTQDPECNRRKDARLLGTPQTIGGLGLQVSGISLMCRDAQVFKAMALSNTPCPIMDVDSNRLLIGREAFEKYREKPYVYIVGYTKDKKFWDSLLAIGRKLIDVEEAPIDRGSLSERFRSSSTRGSGLSE